VAVVAAMVNAVVDPMMTTMGGPDHDAMAIPVDRRERGGRKTRGGRRGGRQAGLRADGANGSDARTEQSGKDVVLGSHYSTSSWITFGSGMISAPIGPVRYFDRITSA
jgi:hypothetical protein